MGVVHDQLGAVALRELGVAAQGRHVAVHAEQALGDQEGAAARVGGGQGLLDGRQVQVRVDHLPAAGQAQAVDQAGVVALVGEGPVAGAEQRREQAHVRLVARREEEGVLRPLEGGEAALELPVATGVAPKQARGRGGETAFPTGRRRHPPGDALGEGRVAPEPQVVVRGEVDTRSGLELAAQVAPGELVEPPGQVVGEPAHRARPAA
jgi:hypothetical protein